MRLDYWHVVQVRVESVRLVLCRVDERDGRLSRLGVGRDEDATGERGRPVCALIGTRSALFQNPNSQKMRDMVTIMTTCSIPWANASSPHFSQYRADALSSPSIMVEPCEKRWTGLMGSSTAIFRFCRLMKFFEERLGTKVCFAFLNVCVCPYF